MFTVIIAARARHPDPRRGLPPPRSPHLGPGRPSAVTEQTAQPVPPATVWAGAGASAVVRYLRRNLPLVLGLALLGGLAAFVGIGHLARRPGEGVAAGLYAPATLRAVPAGHGPARPGSPAMVAGTPLTLRIGFVAGLIGVGLWVRPRVPWWCTTGARSTRSSGASSTSASPSPASWCHHHRGLHQGGPHRSDQMAIVVASLGGSARRAPIRAQVLSLRERGYVDVARLSGTERARDHRPGSLRRTSCRTWRRRS